ncbi:hypothetical protein B296_00027954 [Ensete ventricosum]|uniref:Uncharacterized protein n=1 Tax=Ensete ventricosum TaxID=4639 RepID=A0A426XTY0_ENSVE|nr:hypothetical protein B296_00027954 [Ensete ventricosum]
MKLYPHAWLADGEEEAAAGSRGEDSDGRREEAVAVAGEGCGCGYSFLEEETRAAVEEEVATATTTEEARCRRCRGGRLWLRGKMAAAGRGWTTAEGREKHRWPAEEEAAEGEGNGDVRMLRQERRKGRLRQWQQWVEKPRKQRRLEERAAAVVSSWQRRQAVGRRRRRRMAAASAMGAGGRRQQPTVKDGRGGRLLR